MARQTYGRADLAGDGSLAAELEVWLGERELDVAETTLGNYRDTATISETRLYGTARARAWHRLRPRLTRRAAWAG